MQQQRASPANTKHLYNICTMLANVGDVGSTLYECYTNVLCLLGRLYSGPTQKALLGLEI